MAQGGRCGKKAKGSVMEAQYLGRKRRCRRFGLSGSARLQTPKAELPSPFTVVMGLLL